MTAPLAVARPKLKIALSWILVVLGLFMGLYLLGALAVAASPAAYDHTSWFFKWSELIGIALLAVALLAGSLVAICSRRRAGTFFLVSMPITVFCLAYREAYFTSGGPGTYPSTTVSAWLIGLFVGCALFLFFGLFWLGTHWRRWPALAASHPQNFKSKMTRVVIACLVVLAAIVPVGIACVTLRPAVFGGGCGQRPPVVKARSEDHAVFTARVICVGLSLRNWLSTRSGAGAIHEHRVGDWAIGVVEDRFWGVPSHWPHLVMLIDSVYWQGETYFIDGNRESTLMSYFVPVVSVRYGCTRSKPIQSAALDLRILRRPPPKGATIIGDVRLPAPLHGILERPTTPSYLSGAQIEVSGPDSTTTLTADTSGIYQIEGLPAGDYTVKLLVPDGQTVNPVFVAGNYRKTERSVRSLHLNGDELVESTFDLNWAGEDKTPKQ